MKVLLIGATGNLGLRLSAALLTHGHTVTAYVRSATKLQSLLPAPVHSQISIVQGDAKDTHAIKQAILDSQCDAVVNTAGLAAMAPWGKSDLPEIFRAVIDAVSSARLDRPKPLRVWVMAGLGVLNYPGTETLLATYMPIFLEHRQNLQLLKSLPPDTADWSMLCPATMVPESADVSVPTSSTRGRLVSSATTPPAWQESWVKHIPLIGRSLVCAFNGMRYETTLEQNADLIATDLESFESQWSGKTVGIIDPAKL